MALCGKTGARQGASSGKPAGLPIAASAGRAGVRQALAGFVPRAPALRAAPRGVSAR